MIPAYVPLIVVFATIFALVVLLPVVIEMKRRRDRGPRLFPETTVVEEKPEIPPPPEEAKPRRVKRVPFAKRPVRGERVGEIVRIVGDVSIPSGTEVTENVVVKGRLKVGSFCRLHGSIKATRGIEIGEKSVVEGNVISAQDLVVGPSAVVEGVVDAAGDVILSENARCESVSSSKAIRLGPRAQVTRRILAGTVIHSVEAPPPKPAPEEERMVPVPLLIPTFRRPPPPTGAPTEGAGFDDTVRVDQAYFEGEIDVDEYLKRRRDAVGRLRAPEREMIRIPKVRVPEARPPVELPPIKVPEVPEVPARPRVPSDEEFLNVLRDTYDKLSAPVSFGVPMSYVEISKLRGELSDRLKIEESAVDELLLKVLRKRPDLIELAGAPPDVKVPREGYFTYDGKRYIYLRIKKARSKERVDEVRS